MAQGLRRRRLAVHVRHKHHTREHCFSRSSSRKRKKSRTSYLRRNQSRRDGTKKKGAKSPRGMIWPDHVCTGDVTYAV